MDDIIRGEMLFNGCSLVSAKSSFESPFRTCWFHWRRSQAFKRFVRLSASIW